MRVWTWFGLLFLNSYLDYHVGGSSQNPWKWAGPAQTWTDPNFFIIRCCRNLNS